MLKGLSIEAISYQKKDKFFGRLTALIEEMFHDIDMRLYRDNIALLASGYGARVEKLIKERFNLSVTVESSISFVLPLAIIPFSSDKINQSTATIKDIPKAVVSKFNPFSEKDVEVAIEQFNAIRVEARKQARSFNGQKGTIDRKNAIVTGYLAEARHHLILNIYYLKEGGNLTASEIAAATIHEIGHAFTGLEYHHRLVTTNNAIAEVMREVNNNNKDKAVYIYRSRFGPEELEKAAISKDSEIEDFYSAVVNRYIDVVDSQYQDNFYDATAFEYASDNFAVNFGAGASLTTGLDKLETSFSYRQNRRKYYNISNTLNNALLFTAIGFIIGLEFIPLAGYFIITLFLGYKASRRKPIYDGYKDRHTRIKQDLVNILKDTNIDKEEMRLLLDQYELVKSVEAINHNFEPWAAKMFAKVIPSLRKNRYYKERQQVIENAMNNDLFIANAKLLTL